MATAGAGAGVLVSVEYEVFGKVQGVFFRKHTQKQAVLLGLVGWVQNTKNRTVIGEVQGPRDKVLTMKKWLAETGSPQSTIQKSNFNMKDIPTLTFKDFKIKK